LYLNCVHSGIGLIRAGSELLGEETRAAAGRLERVAKRERDSEDGVDESHDDPGGSRFEALIKLHLLADKLQDSEMMNMSIDELIRMVEEDGLIPNHVNLIHSSTTRDSMLRVLVRDIYVHEAESAERYEFLETSDLHPEFWRDISLEYFRLKNTENSI
jgi:hypothetical protein